MTPNVLTLLIHSALTGLSAVLVKVLISYTSPMWAFAVRSLLSGIALLFVCLFIKNKETILLKHAPLYVLKGSFFRVFIPTSLAYWALQYVSPAKFTLFYNLCPFIIYLLSYLFLGEQMLKRKFAGIAIAFSSIIPLIESNSAIGSFPVTVFNISAPDIALIIAMLSLSYGWIVMKKVMIEKPNLSLYAINAHDLFFGGLFAVFASGFLKVDTSISNPTSFFFMALITIGASALIVQPLGTWHLRHLNATLLALVGLSIPFFSAFFSWIYFGEAVRWEYFMSTALVLVGFIVFNGSISKSLKLIS